VIEVYVALITGTVTIVASIIGFLKFYTDRIIREFKPNGGSSMRDQMNHLEKRVDSIYEILAKGK
jgi:hypothetical protein